MSIATELNKLSTNLENAYTALSAKGAILPERKTLKNLSSTIDSIKASSFESKSNRMILSNGVLSWRNAELEDDTFDEVLSVSDYGMTNAYFSNYGSDMGAIEGAINFKNLKSVGRYGMTQAFWNSNISSFTIGDKLEELKAGSFNQTFDGCKKLKDVKIGGLSSTNLDGQYFFNTFNNCINLERVEFSDILSTLGSWDTMFTNSTFSNCSNLIEVSFPKLKWADGRDEEDSHLYYIFQQAKARDYITRVDFPSLEHSGWCEFDGVFSNAKKISCALFPNLLSVDTGGNQSYCWATTFNNCSSLIRVDFSNLKFIDDWSFEDTFRNCKNLSAIYFPRLTSFREWEGGDINVPFNSEVFIGCTNLTEIHFRMGMESKVSALEHFDEKWGATNATIYFDLGEYDAEIEYLSSDGYQYIDTGLKCNANFEVDITYAPNSSRNLPWYDNFPCPWGFSEIPDWAYYVTPYFTNEVGDGTYEYSDGVDFLGIGLDETIRLSSGQIIHTEFKNVLHEGTIYKSLSSSLDGAYQYQRILSFDSTQTERSDFSFYLFSASDSTPESGSCLRVPTKIYSAKINDGWGHTLDLIPVRIGTVGYMYDKNTGRLFPNLGTGDFILGPDKQ